jgi:hypothetical protein
MVVEVLFEKPELDQYACEDVHDSLLSLVRGIRLKVGPGTYVTGCAITKLEQGRARWYARRSHKLHSCLEYAHVRKAGGERRSRIGWPAEAQPPSLFMEELRASGARVNVQQSRQMRSFLSIASSSGDLTPKLSSTCAGTSFVLGWR